MPKKNYKVHRSRKPDRRSHKRSYSRSRKHRSRSRSYSPHKHHSYRDHSYREHDRFIIHNTFILPPDQLNHLITFIEPEMENDSIRIDNFADKIKINETDTEKKEFKLRYKLEWMENKLTDIQHHTNTRIGKMVVEKYTNDSTITDKEEVDLYTSDNTNYTKYYYIALPQLKENEKYKIYCTLEDRFKHNQLVMNKLVVVD